MSWLFWPMAVTNDGKDLYTYDSCFNISDTLKVFEVWEQEYHYNLKKMWVQVVNGDTGLQERIVKVKRTYIFDEDEEEEE